MFRRWAVYPLLIVVGLVVGRLSCGFTSERLTPSMVASPLVSTWPPHNTGPESKERGAEPLAIIATTMADTSDKTKRKIQRNVLRGYMMQTPPNAIHPLVFTDSTTLAAEVRQETLPTHSSVLDTTAPYPEELHGFPTMRGMMREAQKAARKAGAPYYGYANGDILFTQDLVVTLDLVSEASHANFFSHVSNPQHPGIMIIGRRTNFEFADYSDRLDHETPCELSELFLNIAKDGVPMVPHAIDYFIFNAGALVDWDRLGDWIVGNVAFDQYVVKYVDAAGLTVVDATDTIHAFHQTGSDGNGAGHIRPEAVKAHNVDLWKTLGRGGCKVREASR